MNLVAVVVNEEDWHGSTVVGSLCLDVEVGIDYVPFLFLNQ